MHHRFDLFGAKNRIDCPGIAQVTFDELGLGVDRCSVSLAQIVEHRRMVPGGDEPFDGDTSDISGTTGHQNFHHLLTVQG